jgi:hypothetical protein
MLCWYFPKEAHESVGFGDNGVILGGCCLTAGFDRFSGALTGNDNI